MRLFASLFCLAACAPAEVPPTPRPEPQAQAAPTLPSWDFAREAGVDFRGQGADWTLDIHQHDSMVLVLDGGADFATFPLTAPIAPQDGVTRYETEAAGRTLIVTITRYQCMVEGQREPRLFPAVVDIVLDGRARSGCGRSV